MVDTNTKLSIERADALVLFEYLSRGLDENSTDALKRTTEDDSEFGVLNALLCVLEKELDEPFSADYANLVEAVRQECKKRYGQFP